MKSRCPGIFEDKGFNVQILQRIDRGVSNLGAGVREAFYYQIQERYGITSKDFVLDPDILIDHLKELVGRTGSSLIELLIIREIKLSFKLDLREGADISRSNF